MKTTEVFSEFTSLILSFYLFFIIFELNIMSSLAIFLSIFVKILINLDWFLFLLKFIMHQAIVIEDWIGHRMIRIAKKYKWCKESLNA
jgi:hypothetical protein